MTESDINALFKTLDSMTGTLVEIRDLLKARPAASAAKSGGRATDPRTGDLNAPDEPWARFPWPAFCDKNGYLAKNGEKVLGDSVGTDARRKNLRYWIGAYTPKPGQYAAENQKVRDAIDGAKLWLMKAAAPSDGSTPPPARKPEPTEREMANLPPEGTPEDTSIPY